MSEQKLRIILITTVLLAACNNVMQQRHSVIAGVSRVQAAWNRGACGSVYDDGDGYFRRNQAREHWLTQCAELRQRLGAWKSFDTANGAVWPIGRVGIVWVQGPAVFENGQHTVRADFNLDNGTARLFELQFELDGRPVQIPGWSGRLVD